jgi:hypothetical protein
MSLFAVALGLAISYGVWQYYLYCTVKLDPQPDFLPQIQQNQENPAHANAMLGAECMSSLPDLEKALVHNPRRGESTIGEVVRFRKTS